MIDWYLALANERLRRVCTILLLLVCGAVFVLTLTAAPTSPAQAVTTQWGSIPIVLVDSLPDEAQHVYGEFSVEGPKISLRRDLPPGFKPTVVYHEGCHAALMRVEMDGRLEEQVCDDIAAWLVAQDNKEKTR